jgi:hypothetical protein
MGFYEGRDKIRPDVRYWRRSSRAAHRQTNLKYVLVTAYAKDGVTDLDLDMMEDGRRLRHLLPGSPGDHKARVQRGQVAQLRRRLEVPKIDEVHFDEPVQRPAVEEPQDFGQHQGCRDGSNKRSADSLACEQRDAAAI